ncbi:MAG: immunoglobulin domain-containing protein, partial [Myxococcota bacterium]
MAVPEPTSSHGSTAAALNIAGAEGVLFGLRGFAAGSALPAGFTAGAVVLCIDDATTSPHVGSTLSPNTWYELKLVVDLSTATRRGSLFYRSLTAGQATFTADPLLQNIDLKLTATDAQFTFNTAWAIVFNGAKIDALAASPAMPNTPTIAPHPLSQTVAAGTNVSFSVGAAGTAALTYQWRKNGVDLANGTNASGTVVAGGTASTLTLTGVRQADAGTYTCQVSQATGATTSSAAILAVTTTTDPIVSGYVVMKQRLTVQTSTDVPVPSSAAPLSLQTRVFGSNLAGLSVPSLLSPTAGAARGGALGFDDATKFWRFNSTLTYSELSGSGSLNADYADGAYVLTVAGRAVSLDVQPMASTSFPNSPRIVGGTWLNSALLIDATRDQTVNFEAFANPAAGSRVWLRLVGLGLVGDFHLEPANAGTTSVIIPANTLTPGAGYAAHLVFLNATTSDTTSVGGAVGTGGYAARLDFAVAATGAIPAITSPAAAAATVGTAFNYAMAASNSPTSYRFNGGLPLGLNFSPTSGAIIPSRVVQRLTKAS